jgi:hypothetical protein
MMAHAVRRLVVVDTFAGKEVRDRWRLLETGLRAAETRARDTRRGGARNLATLVESTRQFRSGLREKAAAKQPAR